MKKWKNEKSKNRKLFLKKNKNIFSLFLSKNKKQKRLYKLKLLFWNAFYLFFKEPKTLEKMKYSFRKVQKVL
jgi:hypothetical protein